MRYIKNFINLRERMKSVQSKCTICGSSDWTQFVLTGTFSAVVCKGCSLVYVNARKDIKSQTDYFGDIDVLNNTSYYKDFRLRYYNDSLNLLERFKPEKGNILDVGSSFGWFLHAAHEKGWNVTGLEPSKVSISEMKKEYDYDVINASAEDLNKVKDKYDIITFWNVLEHIKDPSKTLAECNNKLRNDGIIVIVVPNLEGIITRCIIYFHRLTLYSFKSELDRLYQSDNKFMHLYHFSLATLTGLLEKNGFKPLITVRQDIVDPKKIRERLELDHPKDRLNFIRTFILGVLIRLSHLLNAQDELVVYANKN